jgi:hypothetical protein
MLDLRGRIHARAGARPREFPTGADKAPGLAFYLSIQSEMRRDDPGVGKGGRIKHRDSRVTNPARNHHYKYRRLEWSKVIRSKIVVAVLGHKSLSSNPAWLLSIRFLLATLG